MTSFQFNILRISDVSSSSCIHRDLLVVGILRHRGLLVVVGILRHRDLLVVSIPFAVDVHRGLVVDIPFVAILRGPVVDIPFASRRDRLVDTPFASRRDPFSFSRALSFFDRVLRTFYVFLRYFNFKIMKI